VAPVAGSDTRRICLDADVVIAGLFSTEGASHALLVLAEMGLLAIVLPEAAVEEIERNLAAKLPEALPLFRRFLEAPGVVTRAPTAKASEEARPHAHEKDVPILATAFSCDATILATHNARHFKSTARVRVMKPGPLLREIRAWMVRLGG